MLKVTADSNIYISALHFGGNPAKVLELARAGAIQLAVSEAILAEVTRVLRDKFGWVEERIAEAREEMKSCAELVQPQTRIYAVTEDPADNRILECALTAGSGYVVTGDKHLLHLSQYHSTKIVTAAEFLQIVENPRA